MILVEMGRRVSFEDLRDSRALSTTDVVLILVASVLE
jgi:hypothetical protein